MANPKTYAEWVELYRTKSDADIEYDKDFATGLQQKAAMAVCSERKREREDTRQKRESEHTLQTYWRLADLGERFGMVSVFLAVLIVGYLCAKIHMVSQIIDLIRELKP